MGEKKQQTLLNFFGTTTTPRKRQSTDESMQLLEEEEAPSSSSCTSKEVATAEVRKKKKIVVARQYDSNYLKYGFIQEPKSEPKPRPLCVVCSTSLSNHSMKPSKLVSHLRTNHPDLVNKPIEYFQRLRDDLQKQISSFKKMTIQDKSLLRVSYLMALQIGKSKKPYTIGEELIKPCILQACEEILGNKAAQKMKVIPMSARTVKRRIEELAEDVEAQVVEMVKNATFYGIQLDESTDITNKAILLCFVRYTTEECLKEEFLCSLELPGRTTACQVFEALNDYFLKHQIDWGKCVGICTDGAASMTGHRSGVVKRIKEVGHKDINFTHCIIHREQLAAKRLCPEFYEVLSEVIKVVNEIRHKALNSRLFESLCDEMGSQHKHLLLHAEVRWLSRGKVLTRLFNMRQETTLFFQQQNNHKFLALFSNNDWVAKLAYLADIFALLNELTVSIQGQLSDVFNLRSKMDAFQRKILLWQKLLKNKDLQMFPNLDEYMKENDVNREIIVLVQRHLQSLKESFERYYPEEEDPRKGNMWIADPFSSSIEEANLNLKEKESLIELSSDDILKLRFKSSAKDNFWLSVKTEYPLLCEKALKILTPFTTTYLCEKTFSSVTALKNKYRSRLEIEAPLRVAVTSLNPRISKIISNQEQHKSH